MGEEAVRQVLQLCAAVPGKGAVHIDLPALFILLLVPVLILHPLDEEIGARALDARRRTGPAVGPDLPDELRDLPLPGSPDGFRRLIHDRPLVSYRRAAVGTIQK